MKYELFIALRYMLSRRSSQFLSVITIISIGGIAIGVAALVIVLSVMNGFESGIRDKIIGTTSHITVAAYAGNGLIPGDSLYEAIFAVKGVVAAAPVVQGKVAISSSHSTDGVVLRGVEPEKAKKVSDIEKDIIIGKFDFGDRNNPGIVIGFSLAENLGISYGDRVTVFSLKGEDIDPLISRPVASNYTVNGIFETGMYEYDATLVYTSLEEAQWLFSMGELVSFIDVKTEDAFKAASIARKINENLGFQYFASDWSQTHKNLFSWMTLEKWAMFLALSLIVAVAGVNIISNLIMLVLEKRKDIGILRTLGSTAASIKRIFLIKGMIVSIVGIFFGLLLGLGFCYLQYRYSLISLPADIYFISKLPVEVHLTDLIGIVAITSAVTFITSLYPAGRAAALSPAEIIRTA